MLGAGVEVVGAVVGRVTAVCGSSCDRGREKSCCILCARREVGMPPIKASMSC